VQTCILPPDALDLGGRRASSLSEPDAVVIGRGDHTSSNTSGLMLRRSRARLRKRACWILPRSHESAAWGAGQCVYTVQWRDCYLAGCRNLRSLGRDTVGWWKRKEEVRTKKEKAPIETQKHRSGRGSSVRRGKSIAVTSCLLVKSHARQSPVPSLRCLLSCFFVFFRSYPRPKLLRLRLSSHPPSVPSANGPSHFLY
jgi:hypothetical protein